MGWFNEMQRLSASPENAVRLQRVLVARSTSASLLPQVTDADADLPFARRPGRAVLAGRGAGAPAFRARSFVPLESRNHILLESEPAWRMFAELQPRVPQCRRGRLPAVAAAAPKTVRRTRSARASRPMDGTRIAYADDGERLPAGQGAELDDPPAIMTGRARSTATGSRMRRGSAGWCGPTCAASASPNGEPRKFDFEAMVGDLGAVIDDAADRAMRPARHRSRRGDRDRLCARGTRSGCASWCWSTASPPAGGCAATRRRLRWRESLAGDEPAPDRASAAACSARCSSRSISRRPTQELIDWHNELFADARTGAETCSR